MKVLIIGSGGREHALAWKAAQSPQVEQIFVAPGNAGTASENKVQNIAIDVLAIEQLIDFAKQENIALTIVGPEAPLAIGIVDQFQAADLTIFGPSQNAAQLESSKAFSKQFMQKHQIPTAKFAEFTDLPAACEYIKQQGAPIVIKADGLAAGKGVVCAQSVEEAIIAATEMLSNSRFGDAGQKIVVEEFLTGEEVSFIVITDGKNILPLATSQDHKARDNGDSGPNTGGMGAYSPAPIVTPELEQQIMQTVIKPTIDGLAKQDSPYTGFLYAGLMIDAKGQARVLEYNCRMGDPETQPIMLRLQSDLAEICLAACENRLDKVHVSWETQTALGVVMCAGGYPNKYRKGDVILGLTDLQSVTGKVFHAGTAIKDDHVVTNGGRVLCATTLGANVSDAQQKAYQLVDQIHWDGVFFRTDIGHRATTRENDDKRT